MKKGLVKLSPSFRKKLSGRQSRISETILAVDGHYCNVIDSRGEFKTLEFNGISFAIHAKFVKIVNL